MENAYLKIEDLVALGFEEKVDNSNSKSKRVFWDDYFVIDVDCLSEGPDKYRFLGYIKSLDSKERTYPLSSIINLKKYYKEATGIDLS